MMATGRFAGDRIIASIGRKRMLQISGLLVFTGLMIASIFPYIITGTLGFSLAGRRRLFSDSDDLQYGGSISPAGPGDGAGRRFQYRFSGLSARPAADRLYRAGLQPAILIRNCGFLRTLRFDYGHAAEK